MFKKKITIVFITLIATIFASSVFGQPKPNSKGKVIRAIKNKVAAKKVKQVAKPEEVKSVIPEEVDPEATESTITTETATTNDDSTTKNRKGKRIGKTVRKVAKAAIPNQKTAKPNKTSETPKSEESLATDSVTISDGETSAAVPSETLKTESTEVATETLPNAEIAPTEESTESSSSENKSATNSNKRKKIRRMVKKIIANHESKSTKKPAVKKPNE